MEELATYVAGQELVVSSSQVVQELLNQTMKEEAGMAGLSYPKTLTIQAKATRHILTVMENFMAGHGEAM